MKTIRNIIEAFREETALAVISSLIILACISCVAALWFIAIFITGVAWWIILLNLLITAILGWFATYIYLMVFYSCG